MMQLLLAAIACGLAIWNLLQHNQAVGVYWLAVEYYWIINYWNGRKPK